jgi:hypothetical protein
MRCLECEAVGGGGGSRQSRRVTAGREFVVRGFGEVGRIGRGWDREGRLDGRRWEAGRGRRGRWGSGTEMSLRAQATCHASTLTALVQTSARRHRLCLRAGACAAHLTQSR